MSGQFRIQGEQALAGLQAWAADVNRAGGIRLKGQAPGSSIETVHYDDCSKRAVAKSATERLITQDRVDLLFGPYSGLLTQAAAEVSEAHGRLLWNQGGASDSIYEKGFKWVVGVLTPASRYLSGLLPLVREADPEAKSLAVLRVSPGPFARAVSAGVEHAAGELGFQMDLLREYSPSIEDFNPVLDEVERAGPRVLLAVGRIYNDLQFAKQLADRGIDLGTVAVVAAPIQQFKDALGDAAERFVGPSQWESAGSFFNGYGPTGEQVLESLRAKSRYPIDYPMVQAYAAGLVAQRCVETAGTLDDRALRETAARLDVSTFYGRFKIDPATGRQEGRSGVIVQWQNGRKVIVWPSEQRQAQLVYPWRPRIA